MNNSIKNLNVPNLRFPEFGGEWSEHTLSEFFEFKNGLNPDAKRIGKGIPFISVMDILADNAINYDNIRGKVEATDNEIEIFGVNYGDILFQRSSETFEDIGRANVYLDNRIAVYGGFVIRGRKIGSYNPMFFKYLLATHSARKKTCRMGAGAQHFNIGQEGLAKVSVYVPKFNEQEKVAFLLTLIDERIATQKKIIEELKKLKSAISKLILNRLVNAEVVRLDMVADIYQPQTISLNELTSDGLYNVYGANGVIGKYDNYNHETAQICIACRGNTCGTVNYTSEKSWITGNAMVVNTDGYDIDKRYLFHYLSNIDFSPIISGSGQPQIVRQPLSKINVKLPTISEQKLISGLLDKYLMFIALEEKILDDYQKQKCSLLAQMFI